MKVCQILNLWDTNIANNNAKEISEKQNQNIGFKNGFKNGFNNGFNFEFKYWVQYWFQYWVQY